MQPRKMLRRNLSLVFVLVAADALADDPAVGPTASGQAVADALKDFTSSDIALIPAGLLKDTDKLEKKDEVATALAFDEDGIVVINLTGAKIREALERSISAYPQSSVGFLQLGGLEVNFKKTAPAKSRLVSVQLSGSKLDDAKIYSVAMPLSLQRGQLGYANLWENITIAKKFDKTTLGMVVKGRKVGTFVARWSPQS